MSKNKSNSYIELAKLVGANISGPVKQELVKKAQKRLADALTEAKMLTSKEAGQLYI